MKLHEESDSNYENALTIAGQATGYRSRFYAETLLDTAVAYVNTGPLREGAGSGGDFGDKRVFRGRTGTSQMGD